MKQNEVGIESVKQFWDARPCNIRHSNKPLGSKEYFDEVEIRKYFVEPHIPKFADFATWKGKSVLEIGCGIGTDAVNFARAGAIYTGIELSEESLKIARNRFNLFDLEGNLLLGNAENLDSLNLKSNFDLIYSFGVLHHTPNISKALSGIKRMASKNSIIKIMVYAKNSWKQVMINAGLDQPEGQPGCPIANSYSKEEISQLLFANGIQPVTLEQDHIFPYVIESYKNYQYTKQPWFECMPNEVFKVLEKDFGWHLLITAKLL
jgi:ubiquinone/menaquinone biosynthesis C-methylase UbiE